MVGQSSSCVSCPCPTTGQSGGVHPGRGDVMGCCQVARAAPRDGWVLSRCCHQFPQCFHSNACASVSHCNGSWHHLDNGCGGTGGYCSLLWLGCRGPMLPSSAHALFFPSPWRPQTWVLWGCSRVLGGTLGNPCTTSHPTTSWSSCRRVSPAAGGACGKDWSTGHCGTRRQPRAGQRCSACSPRPWASPVPPRHPPPPTAPRPSSPRWR